MRKHFMILAIIAAVVLQSNWSYSEQLELSKQQIVNIDARLYAGDKIRSTPSLSDSDDASDEPLKFVPKNLKPGSYDLRRWKTYKSKKYAFQITYPPDLTLVIPPDQHDYAYSLGDPTFGYDYDPRFRSIVKFVKGTKDQDSSERIHASLVISVATKNSAVIACGAPPKRQDYVDYSSSAKVRIDQREFSVFDAVRDSAKVGLNGGSFAARYFRIRYNNICYSITISDSGAGFTEAPDFIDRQDAEDQANRYGFPFNAWDAFDELNATAFSFNFIDTK